MSAKSLLQQRAIAAILETMEELGAIKVLATFRGDTVNEVDAAMAGLGGNGKPGGACILVQSPLGKPDSERDTVPVPALTHRVLVIEVVKMNRLADGAMICGLTNDDIKDLVIQRLHARRMNGATLQWAGWEDYEDDAGCFGYTLKFSIKTSLATENRAAVPVISITGTTVTLTGGNDAGEVLRYTTDETPPVENGPTVQIYTAPFVAQSGDIIMASATATDRPLSDFQQKTVS